MQESRLEAPSSVGTVPAPAPPELRLLALQSIAFLLDITGFNRGDEDLLNGLLLASIVQANVERVHEDREQTLQFATPGQVPPDELRRPISILALANSLGLPFETTRRRVQRLVGRGFCEMTPKGVIVPARAANTDSYRRNSLAAYERTRAFYLDLRARGRLAGLPPLAPWEGGSTPPTRLVGRAITSYILRTIEHVMAALHDFVDGLILLEIVRSNTEPLSAETILSIQGYLPDDLRVPLPVQRLAERLGLTRETARRHVVRLTEAGYCLRKGGGVIVPNTVLARETVTQAIAANAGNLQRMFAGLAGLGVLALWEAEAAEMAGKRIAPSAGPAAEAPSDRREPA